MTDMTISGFSFVRNGVSLYYPVAESIRSILPICDEFVVAVGRGDPGDRTREVIASIGDPRIRILDTVWDEATFRQGASNAVQTDLAKVECTGDWLFYVQADEVVHEAYLPVVERRCRDLLDDARVEGLLFRYRHFWADYEHVLDSHAWYAREIRVVRNLPQIHSWHSAQSFRYYHDYRHPWQTSDTRKLRVADVDAEIFHYGWVRPPHLMQRKNRALREVHAGRQAAEAQYAAAAAEFDFGPLKRLPVYRGSHPAVMRRFMARFDWGDRLRDEGDYAPGSERPRHERLKYRVMTWIEKAVFGGNQLFASHNYRRVRV